MDNQEKNTYVKTQLTAALLELLEEKALRDISISEIASAAGVHRVSFYRNYREKEDILREHVHTTYERWTRSHPEREAQDGDEQIRRFFAYLEDNGPFYRLLQRRELLHLLKEALLASVGPKPEFPNVFAYATAFMASGLYGWTEEWFKRGMQESAEEIAVLLKQQRETPGPAAPHR